VEDPIKISDQKKVKFEVILGEDEIKMMYLQEKPKKDTYKIKKINK
jgi:hypothetical protein